MEDLLYKVRLICAHKDFFRSRIPFLYQRMIKHSQKQTCKAWGKLHDKDVIEVAFLLTIPGMWKLDYLFRMMVDNPHYHPYIVIYPYSTYKSFSSGEVEKTLRRTEQFVKNKGFEYIIPYDSTKNNWVDIKKRLNPDIVFFTTPYRDVLRQYFVYNFLDKVTCYVPYGFSSLSNYHVNYDILSVGLYSVNFAESAMHRQFAEKYSRSKGVNFEVTGYPGVEVFLDQSYVPQEVWKRQSHPKTRIIWAPHQSIPVGDGKQFLSNFLELYDDMLQLADKYSDTVQFAFKPHQLLRFKLNEVWGVNKTNAYYKKWSMKENTQLEETSYVDLFIGSDAMIHDCGSFTTEYLFQNKPVMYITKSDNYQQQFNEFGKLSFGVHYHGSTIADIENFIQKVVLEGNDPLKEPRQKFYEEYLLPKDGLLPSQKILAYIENKIKG